MYCSFRLSWLITLTPRILDHFLADFFLVVFWVEHSFDLGRSTDQSSFRSPISMEVVSSADFKYVFKAWFSHLCFLVHNLIFQKWLLKQFQYFFVFYFQFTFFMALNGIMPWKNYCKHIDFHGIINFRKNRPVQK